MALKPPTPGLKQSSHLSLPSSLDYKWCLMIFNPKGKKKMIKHLRNNQFDYFVYIDEKDTINRLNNFLKEEELVHFYWIKMIR